MKKRLRVIISGANGAMGRVVLSALEERGGFEAVAGIDTALREDLGFPVYRNANECDAPADVIIDFSHPLALAPLLEMAVRRGLPAVIATTGYNASQIAEIERAAWEIPIFFTFNMSLGINLMVELAKTAARVLGEDFDIEIIDRHHNKKIDAPSGTAIMLADSISAALSEEPQYVYDRRSRRSPRVKNEIGIHSVRGGSIVGEHEVMFAGKDEILTIGHSARSRQVFATGAINAAQFIVRQKPGLYNMADLVASNE
jgi:4-hydroxy-tetrahydrodipicolinate reductase